MSPITYRGQEVIRRDIDNLKFALRDVEVTEAFMPAVAPGSVVPDCLNEHYQNDRDFIFAVGDALNEEYRAIVKAGFLLQVDDAHLPVMYERMVPPWTIKDYLAWADLRIEALNRALSGIPEDRVRYHLCWGSWNAPHTSDIPLKDIVHLLLRLRVGGYSIEAANVRHEHEWRVWETVKLPADKVLIPGVISHATNVVEHPELVAQRIIQFAALVGRENVLAGTDCGFAQGPYVRRSPSVDHVVQAGGASRRRAIGQPRALASEGRLDSQSRRTKSTMPGIAVLAPLPDVNDGILPKMNRANNCCSHFSRG